MSVLVVAGLLAATAAALAVARLYGPEPPPASSEAAPAHGAPERSPSVAEAGQRAEQASAAARWPGGSEGLQAQEEAAGNDPTAAGRADEHAATRDEAAGAALAAARERIAELEAAGARYGATIAGLRTELEDARAEARVLGEQLEVSQRGIEGLNAMLAAMLAGGRSGSGEDELQAGPREAGEAEPAPVPAEAAVGASVNERGEAVHQGPAPADATAGAPPAEDGGDGLQTAGAQSYAAIYPVNLRAAPSNTAEVLAVIEEGDMVRRVGERGGWLRAEYSDHLGRDVVGWVHNRHLRRAEPPHEGGGPSARADD